MSAARRDDDLLEQIFQLARAYGLRRWGQVPIYLSIHLPDGREQREVMPHVPLPPACQAGPEDEPAAADPRAAPDFREVYWPGLGTFRFSRKQREVIKLLWEARFEGDSPDVDQVALLEGAGSDSARLHDLFKNSKDRPMGRLIIPGGKQGSYRLPELPDDED